MPNTGVVNLIKGDSKDANTDFADAIPVNMTAVAREIMGAKGYMIQQPGIALSRTLSGADRGGIWNEVFSKHLRVSGTSLVDASDGTVIGTISGSGQVSLPYSFNTQGIVADGKFFLYDPVGGLVEVTDPDLGNPIDACWIDGYYFFTDGDYLYHTDISDETSISPLNFATSEFSPDPTLGVARTSSNLVAVFNRYTTEYFYDDASAAFAFSRARSRAAKTGIVGTHAKTESNGNFYIMGSGKNEEIGVHVMGVGTAQRVSTREIDKIINSYSESSLSGVVMESRTINGDEHIIIHIPEGSPAPVTGFPWPQPITLLFNVAIAAVAGLGNAWTILRSGTGYSVYNNNNYFDEYRAINGVYVPTDNKWYYGDKTTGKLGYLDNTICTQYGEEAEWMLTTPFVQIENTSVNWFEIDTIPAVPLSFGGSGPSTATVAFSLTFDGYVYGTESYVNYGTPNNYTQRFMAYRLGYVRNYFAIRFRGTTSARVAMAKLRVNYG